MKKIPPSKRVRNELREILEEGVREGNLLSEFLQKGMQLIMQELRKLKLTQVSSKGTL